MSEWRYIIAAYGVTWVVLAGYALYLGATARRSAAMVAEATRDGGEP